MNGGVGVDVIMEDAPRATRMSSASGPASPASPASPDVASSASASTSSSLSSASGPLVSSLSCVRPSASSRAFVVGERVFYARMPHAHPGLGHVAGWFLNASGAVFVSLLVCVGEGDRRTMRLDSCTCDAGKAAFRSVTVPEETVFHTRVSSACWKSVVAWHACVRTVLLRRQLKLAEQDAVRAFADCIEDIDA